MRASQFDDQRGTGRIEQGAANGGQRAGKPQYPGLIGHRHGGKARRTQQHAGDDHRFGAKTVGNRSTKDPQSLLNELA
ncbi:Uncharacterised protein [Serratia fonticola]|uniref:Uncharacterized protein n=1 Tax=Serratia fonticola TaxID=47917 RepID=A0A4U9TIF1_SERFO|nr:Uncharacterised protein [Serratia fonticola]